jgi:hypothetical protein
MVGVEVVHTRPMHFLGPVWQLSPAGQAIVVSMDARH